MKQSELYATIHVKLEAILRCLHSLWINNNLYLISRRPAISTKTTFLNVNSDALIAGHVSSQQPHEIRASM